MEEASNFTEYDYNQLNNVRLRGKTTTPKQCTMYLNPISVQHWIKKRFWDNRPAGTAYFEHCETDPEELKAAEMSILKTTHIDNRFYGENERKELLKLKDIDKYYYDVYVLGNWGVLGNLVFTNYIIEDFEYTEKDLENVCQGQDYGFAHASTIIRLGFKDDEIYIFDEVYGKGWTNGVFIEAAEEQLGTDAKYFRFTGDSAEPDRIKDWNDNGWNVDPAKKGKGSLRFGIDFLCGHRIHIHATKCPNMAREIQTYKRREDKDGNALDEFVEINDDCIAAARYATEYIWGQYHGRIVDNYGAADLGL